MATQLSNPFIQHFIGNQVNAGGQIFFFEVGSTTTPKDTFSDFAGTIPNTNPVILDQEGREPPIFIEGSYRVVIKTRPTVTDSTGIQVSERDNVGFISSDSFADWDAATGYEDGGSSIVTGSDGNYYVSIQTPNVGNDPVTSPAFWTQISFIRDFNVNESYSIPQIVRTSAGFMYRSKTNNNLGNDPDADDGTNWDATISPSSLTGIDLKSGRTNFIFNPAFTINQRMSSGTVVLASGDYGHDRWRGGPGGGTYTFAISGGLTTITITSGTLEQEIEGTDIESITSVLSWEGTAEAQIDGGGFGDSGEVTETVFGGSNATVEFNTGTVTKVQLEEGTISTNFGARPEPTERMLCERYFYLIQHFNADVAGIGAGFSDSTGTFDAFVPTKELRRVSPTFTISSLSDFEIDITGSNATAATSLVQVAFGANGRSVISFSQAAAFVSGEGGMLRFKAAAATTAFMAWDAEL